MQERRKYPRVNYPCKIMVAIEKKKEEFSLHTENISSGGARVILQKEFPINSPVAIEIVIGERKIKTNGRIVWVIDVKTPDMDKPDFFDTGVEFTHLRPEDREFLSGLIGKLLEDMQRA